MKMETMSKVGFKYITIVQLLIQLSIKLVLEEYNIGGYNERTNLDVVKILL